MEAKELRIGNKVKYLDVDVFIMGISNHKVELGYFTDSIGFTRSFNEIEPIPLTQERLDDFNIDEYGTYYQAGADSWSLVDDFHGGGVTIYLGNCKYVHQLQNLYFALTGEELNAERVE